METLVRLRGVAKDYKRGANAGLLERYDVPTPNDWAAQYWDPIVGAEAKATREGVYYGQCSELCGKDHAYMPIAVRVVVRDVYSPIMRVLDRPSEKLLKWSFVVLEMLNRDRIGRVASFVRDRQYTHLLRRAGGTGWFNTPNDCYYANTRPSWDAARLQWSGSSRSHGRSTTDATRSGPR